MSDPLLFSLVQDLEFQTGYRIKQVVACDQFTRVAQQQQQDREGLGFDRQRLAVAAHRVRGGIDEDPAETVTLAFRSPLPGAAVGFHRKNLISASSTCAKAEGTLACTS